MSGIDGWLGENIPDEMMEEAASWMALLDSSGCTPADRARFAQWLSADPLHHGAFGELSEVWARLRILSDVPVLVEHPNVVPFPVAPRERAVTNELAPKSSEWSTLAASLLIIVGCVLHFSLRTPSDIHVTGVGEVQALSLEDGSRVELNARSSIQIQIDDKRREIRLSDGEAVFQVQTDPRPFIVRTDIATVSAVGTQFSVRADSSLVEVSVIEGLVSVAAANAGTALTEYEGDLLVRFSDEIALLGAGQRIELTRESQRYEIVAEKELDDELSWRNGEVVFTDTPLIAALAEMRRYQRLSIIVGDPVLNSLRVSGRFPTDDAAPFLLALREQHNVIAETDDNRYIVLRLE
jgi:transmembrane sensor